MDDYSSRIDGAFDAIDWDWTEIRAPIEKILVGIAVAAGEEAVSEFGLFDDDVMDRMRVDARVFAQDRAAEMVGMVRHGELLLPNPDPEWTIADASRDMIRGTVTKALKEGWSAQELAKAVRESEAFGPARAINMARTELAIADTQGSIRGWKATGLVAGREWLTAPGCCDFCHTLNGMIVPIDEPFPHGDSPAHPSCRCTELPVLPEDMPGALAAHEHTHTQELPA